MIERKDWLPWPQHWLVEISCPKCSGRIMVPEAKIDEAGNIMSGVVCSDCEAALPPTRLVGYPTEISND